ncbi:MAG TPA: response regulator [Candidatus Saccharimonadales bacterium]|nr:response regulator [Candidatus Saccharimonadales bacterium]
MNPDQQPKKRIVLVEDDPALAEIYKTRLEAQGYNCFVAYNGIIALYFIQKDRPDLVLLDLMIPDISGGDVLRTMRKSSWGKDIPVYVISNLSEAQAPPDIHELGISGYSVKANLPYGEVDVIVNTILKPNGGDTSGSAQSQNPTHS